MKIHRWLTILACLYLGLATLVFSSVASLQQSKTHSQLIRDRLAISVKGASRPFETVISLGLPVSMLRNRAEVLARAIQIDPSIYNVVLFNPSGIIVEQAVTSSQNAVSESVLKALRRSEYPDWSTQTESHLIAGHSIYTTSGQVVGAIYASYPLTELTKLSWNFRWTMLKFSALACILGGFLSWLAFKALLRPSESETLLAAEADISGAEEALVGASADLNVTNSLPVQLQALHNSDFNRHLNRRTSAVFASLTLVTLVGLAWVSHAVLSKSLVPELDRRAALVAHTLTENVKTAIEAGIPADQLVGLKAALQDMQARFPEVRSISISLSGIETSVGSPTGRTYREVVQFSPYDTGVVSVSSDPRMLTRQFRALFLDLSVIVVFTALLAVEIATILLSKSLIGPISGLAVVARSVLDGRRNLVFSPKWPAELRLRAQRLNTAILASAPNGAASVHRLRLASLADVRLGLFLFAVADEAPLSFFVLFMQDLPNDLAFVPSELAISLPFAGYLISALICAPLARPLGQKIGYRQLFITAALLTAVAKIGLLSAPSILVATLWQSLNGALFVLAMLACQDYLLDLLPSKERVRSMAIFRAVLFSGVFAGTAIGGILADRIGEPAVFAFCAGLATIAAVLIWMQMAPLGEVFGSVDEDQRLSLGFLKCFGDWRFVLFALGVIAPQAIIDHVFISYLLALLMDDAGASIRMIAQVMMLFFLALTLAGQAAGHIKFVSTAPQACAGLGTLAAGAVIWHIGAAPSFEGLLFVAVVSGAALGLSAGPITAIVVHLSQTSLSHLGLTNVLGMVRVLERAGAAAAMVSAGAFAASFGFERTTSMIGIYACFAAAGFVVVTIATRPADRVATSRKE
ncbi:hypothetical protein DL239_09645 [Sedimentitalea sp. CY04]|uniref:Major facilitator superfamily (MFS) profile domain-containing protein n=1 Tax=Parasedimentitalea denitrificans TaxID=2211118 RepID=A0ABX0W6F6_9RHOB|nr:MFS transporter [Sedimentitalea sp. CY04]NIZ61238.1 hypothetical protein [Sedimentitalea sp. CY04]